MNFLGMGPGELMIVMILALIVFGPGKLPEIGQGLGKAIKEFRKATSQITDEFTRELQIDTPPQEPRRAEPAAPEQSRQDEAPAAVAQTEPLVLEIKRPEGNGSVAPAPEAPAALETAPAVEASATETAAAPRVRRTRKAAVSVVEPATEAVAEAETAAAPKPRRRRKVAEETEAVHE